MSKFSLIKRKVLVNKLFSPEDDVVIKNETDLQTMLVHFFTEGKDMSRFEGKYRGQIQDRILARTGKRNIEKLSYEEKKKIEVALIIIFILIRVWKISP